MIHGATEPCIDLGGCMTGFWRPMHDDHAIEAMALILNFSSDIPPLVMQKVRDRADAISSKLGLSEQRPVFEYDLAADGAGVATQSESGRIFMSVADLSEAQVAAGQFNELLAVERNSIGYRNAAYRSWSETRDRFCLIMDELLPLVEDVMAFSRIRFEYSDRFVWEGDWAFVDVAQLVRPNSKYIAPHIYGSPEMWHCHTGAYLPEVTEGRGRVLQLHMQSGRWRHLTDSSAPAQAGVSLMTAREDRFDVNDVELSSAAYNMLQDDLDAMHDDLIVGISEVLGDEMLSKIGLKAKSQ
jgi:hypothetical protein